MLACSTTFNRNTMSQLFSPLTIKNITFRNRIAVSPMCQYAAADGFANDWHLVHLGSRAVGGAGLVITEATAVSAEGRISPEDLGIWKEAHIENLQRITRFIEAQGAVPGIQLAHAGRKASTSVPWQGGAALPAENGGWQVQAPSAVPFSDKYPFPEAMDYAGIEAVIQDFKAAAGRALQAGFKVIELHAAHGYLINQFLSPLSNRRTDAYGGSFANRVRLLLNIITAVQEVWPADLPLFVRISATEWAEGGWTEADSIQLAQALKEAGVDLVDCSTGGNTTPVKIPVGPLYQLPFARHIKQQTGIRTGAVGMITTPQQAEDIIASGDADLVLLAREMLRDPYFPLHAAHALQYDIQWPQRYDRAKPPRS